MLHTRRPEAPVGARSQQLEEHEERASSPAAIGPKSVRHKIRCEALVRPYYSGRTDRLSGTWMRTPTIEGNVTLVPPVNWQDWRCLRRATRRISISGQEYFLCWQHRSANQTSYLMPR
jgi:hypothetical protein